MCGGIGVSIGVTVQASHPTTWFFAAAILRLVELLLWKRGKEQSNAFELFRIKDTVENLVVVFDCDDLTLRDIAEIRSGCEIDSCWEVREKMVWEYIVQVEAGEISPVCLLISSI